MTPTATITAAEEERSPDLRTGAIGECGAHVGSCGTVCGVDVAYPGPPYLHPRTGRSSFESRLWFNLNADLAEN